MRKPFDILILVLYCGVIFWLSAQPVLPTPQLFENEDKLHHFIAYAIMGICTWRAFRHTWLSNKWIMAISINFCLLYGLSDEWHQSFVPGRNPNLFDWLADSIGAIFACYGYYRFSLHQRIRLANLN